MTTKYIRPPFILSKIINPFIMLFGLMPFLTVKGRKSGKLIHVPVIPLVYKDSTYLVAPRGETQWVRNLRFMKNGQLTQKGKTRTFRTIEIVGKEQDAVVIEYKKQVKMVEAQFRQLPNNADHPVFRLDFDKK